MSEVPSDLFMNCICDQGTPSIDCGCGRTHFATGPQSCEEESAIKSLRRRAKAEPDKYIEHDYDGISVGEFDGRLVVWGCKCNERLGRYEQFIWDHREKIVRYIKERTRKELSDANRMADQMTGL